MKRMHGRKLIVWSAMLLLLPAMAEAKVIAMDAVKGVPIQAETLISSNGTKKTLVDQKNIKIEMAPYSVAEFSSDGVFKLLRGSASLESSEERTAATNSARIDFVGTLVVSFDHKEKSTSAFVAEGEARLKNPHEPDFSLRLDRGRGASMILGDVYPQLVRDISPAQVNSWLQGYAWSAEDRGKFTSAFSAGTGRALAVVEHSQREAEPVATRLEDYFTSIEEERPDLYDRRFGKGSDPDKIVETAQAERKVASEKTVAPEEAALIAMPNTKINLDLGLPEVFASNDDARAEVVAQLKRDRAEGTAKEPERKIASQNAVVAVTVIPKKPRLHKDEDISDALVRLTEIRKERRNAKVLRSGVPGYLPAQGGRMPASIETPIPDPVYDFSENF